MFARRAYPLARKALPVSTSAPAVEVLLQFATDPPDQTMPFGNLTRTGLDPVEEGGQRRETEGPHQGLHPLGALTLEGKGKECGCPGQGQQRQKRKGLDIHHLNNFATSH